MMWIYFFLERLVENTLCISEQRNEWGVVLKGIINRGNYPEGIENIENLKIILEDTQVVSPPFIILLEINLLI